MDWRAALSLGVLAGSINLFDERQGLSRLHLPLPEVVPKVYSFLIPSVNTIAFLLQNIG